MSRFFIKPENIVNDRIIITNNSDIQHIVKVLRHRIGDKLELSGISNIVYTAEIMSIESDKIETKVVDKKNSDNQINVNITLAQSILKSQKQDIVIQKATELGVYKIIPLITKNTVVKIDSDKDKLQKVSRWQKIADEASKQCERLTLPLVDNISNLNELIKNAQQDLILACVERQDDFTIKSVLANNKEAKNILLIIGPEGGWSQEEIMLFKKSNIHTASLGKLILRAETAIITALADIIYEFEL